MLGRLGVGILTLAAASAWADAPVRPIHDTDVAIDSNLVRGAPASAFLKVSAAYGLRDSRPVQGATTSLTLQKGRKRVAVLAAPITDSDGRAVARFDVPLVPPGDYEVVVRTRSPHGKSEVSKSVVVRDHTLLHLRTDRGVYKPGQLVRWRLTALNRANAHPIAGDAEVTLRDPRGTQIWRGKKSLDASGSVAGEVPLGDDLVLGRYRVEAQINGTTTNETIDVRTFRLAPFKVSIEAQSPLPASEGTFRATVVARHPSGEPVQGSARVTAPDFNRDEALDKFGRASIEIPLSGSDPARIVAVVTDGAHRQQRTTLDVPMRSDRLELTVVGSGHAVKGRLQSVIAVTSDGDGHLVPATVYVKREGRAGRTRRTSAGAVAFDIPAETARVDASAIDAEGRVATFTWWRKAAKSNSSVVTPRAVVEEGEPIDLEGWWPEPSGPVIATLMREGAPMTTAPVAIGADGRIRGVLRAPQGVFGLADLRVSELRWDPKTGAIRERVDHTKVYLTPARLDLSVRTLDTNARATQHFRPGTKATLDISVRDARGQPAAGVGLSASVTDERVLALSEPRPDIAKVLRNLDVDSARGAGLVFAELLGTSANASRNLVLRAILDAVPDYVRGPDVSIPAATRLASELGRVRELRPRVYDYLLHQARPLGKRDSAGNWDFIDPLPDLIGHVRDQKTVEETPWKQPTSWSYARELVPEWTFDIEARSIAAERLDALESRLYELRRSVRASFYIDAEAASRTLVVRRRLGAHLVLDPWGTWIRFDQVPDIRSRSKLTMALRSAGPDRRFDTADDFVRDDIFRELPSSGFGTGYGLGGGGFGAGRGALAPSVRVGNAMSTGAVDVNIRKRFDETVLWVAGVKTDAKGRASLDVDLADSITGWRVAVEAVSKLGAVGAVQTRLTTSLPLSVDVEVPDTLTIDDSFELSPVLANHSDSRRALVAQMKVSGSAQATAETEASVVLPPGATTAVRLPIRAVATGTATIQLTLLAGGVAVDSVERTITVLPRGALERRLVTANIAEGTTRIEIELPASVSDGTLSGMLRVFRGASDQALDGLEGMLREPYGCFEQTSSTTYPNLLVLDLLDKGSSSRQIRDRAYELVGKGYQRLVSYEVDGGGFSWFGDAPANQVLTAYGLMEFVDMSKVYPVDSELIDRTRKWILSKQRADGSWAPDDSWLHDWDAVQGKVSTTAYIAWALAESGYRGRPLRRALEFLRSHRRALAKDSYLLGLWATTESRIGSGNSSALSMLMQRAVEDKDGLRVASSKRTLFYASGKSADVQVTALAAMALQASGKSARARQAVSWLGQAKSANYGWGTTQSTVLALRAATAMTTRAKPLEGHLVVRVDGRRLGDIDLGGPDVPSLALPKTLRAGSHVIEIQSPSPETLQADLRWKWRGSTLPQRSTEGLEVTLGKDSRTPEPGERTKLYLQVANPGKDAIAMPTIVVPIPPGFLVEDERLQRLVKSRALSKVENQGSELHLYLSSLASKASARFEIPLRAESVCDVMLHPATAYAYYDPAVRGASESLRLSSQRSSTASHPTLSVLKTPMPRPQP